MIESEGYLHAEYKRICCDKLPVPAPRNQNESTH